MKNIHLKEELEKYNYVSSKSIIEKLDTEEELKRILIPLIEDYGLFILSILIQLAEERKEFYMYAFLGYILSFSYNYINGAEELALFYFIKAHNKNKKDINIIHAILDFREEPNNILSEKDFIYYSNL